MKFFFTILFLLTARIINNSLRNNCFYEESANNGELKNQKIQIQMSDSEDKLESHKEEFSSFSLKDDGKGNLELNIEFTSADVNSPSTNNIMFNTSVKYKTESNENQPEKRDYLRGRIEFVKEKQSKKGDPTDSFPQFDVRVIRIPKEFRKILANEVLKQEKGSKTKEVSEKVLEKSNAEIKI